MHDRDLATALREGGVPRRQALKYLGALGVGLATVSYGPQAARAANLNYFTWGGYDDPNLFPGYADAHGNPEMPVYADGEEAFQKVRTGYTVDVIHPCFYDNNRWRDATLIQPIDTARLKNWSALSEDLRNLKGTVTEEGHWFVPVDWGETSITYRTDLVEFPDGEETWGVLWDEKYADKIALINSAEDSWWCAAVYAGIDLTRTDDKGLILVPEEDILKVREVLTQQRDLVRMYSSDMTAVEQALASGELVAAITWNSSALNLRTEGHPVKFANPKEGALGWCCGLILHSAAPNPDLAYEFIDSMLSAEAAKYIIEAFGYGHSNLSVYADLDETMLADRGLTKDPNETLKSRSFLGGATPEVTERINRDWEEITAGF